MNYDALAAAIRQAAHYGEQQHGLDHWDRSGGFPYQRTLAGAYQEAVQRVVYNLVGALAAEDPEGADWGLFQRRCLTEPGDIDTSVGDAIFRDSLRSMKVTTITELV